MPPKENVPIEGLLENYETALTQTGYSITTKLLLVRRAELVIWRHQNAGLVYFDQTIINCYTGEIDRFVSYVCTGRIDVLPSTLHGARQELTPRFERIAEEFIAGDFHPNTRCDIRWVTYKSLHDWRNRASTAHPRSKLCTSKISSVLFRAYAPSTVHNVWLYLKKLHSFLYETRRTESSYSELFSFSINFNQLQSTERKRYSPFFRNQI